MKKGDEEEVDDPGRYNVFYSADEWTSVQLESGYEIVDMEETIETRKCEADRVQHITWIVCLV